MGYEFKSKVEINGLELPVIETPEKDRRMFIQCRNGEIKVCYSNKQESLSEALKMDDLTNCCNMPKQTILHNFLCGIIDFEFKNEYKHKKR